MSIPRTLVGIQALIFIICCGCGKYNTHSVSGRVTLPDGTPLDELQLVFERTEPQPPISARAITDENGCYRLSTIKAGDGAPTGKYRIVAAELVNSVKPRPSRIHSKYLQYDTSGLEFEVKGEDCTFDIQLDPAVEKSQ